MSTSSSSVAGQNTNHPLFDTDILTVGGTSTTTAEFVFDPNTGNAVFGSTTSAADTNIVGGGGTSTFGGPITMQGFPLSTSTIACPDGFTSGCNFYGPDSVHKAWQAGYQSVRMIAGTYTITQPQLFIENGTTLIGEGDKSVFSYNGTGIKVAIMSGSLGTPLVNNVFERFRVNETGAGGRSTCIDISKTEYTRVKDVLCDKHKIGVTASTSQSYYNTVEGVHVTHLTSTNGVHDAFAFYFGDNGSGDGGPIHTTIINPSIHNYTNGSSTGYYFNSHSIKCIGCQSESGYIGMELGPLASDFEAKGIYLEANKINLQSQHRKQVSVATISPEISRTRVLLRKTSSTTVQSVYA